MVKLHDEAAFDRIDARIVFEGELARAIRKAATKNRRTIQQEIRYHMETLFLKPRTADGR